MLLFPSLKCFTDLLTFQHTHPLVYDGKEQFSILIKHPAASVLNIITCCHWGLWDLYHNISARTLLYVIVKLVLLFCVICCRFCFDSLWWTTFGEMWQPNMTAPSPSCIAHTAVLSVSILNIHRPSALLQFLPPFAACWFSFQPSQQVPRNRLPDLMLGSFPRSRLYWLI